MLSGTPGTSSSELADVSPSGMVGHGTSVDAEPGRSQGSASVFITLPPRVKYSRSDVNSLTTMPGACSSAYSCADLSQSASSRFSRRPIWSKNTLCLVQTYTATMRKWNRTSSMVRIASKYRT